MGLRINTNVSGLRALRNLRMNESRQSGSLERLSTGLRINRASDDPAGLIISEQLRSQIGALEQAVENSQDASNLINTADSALAEVQTILADIKDSIVFAQNTGGATPEQIAAEQDAVDNSIAAIDRIAATTRFADRSLLNGTAQFTTTSTTSAGLDNLTIRSAVFAGTQDTRSFSITHDVVAERAQVDLAAADTVGATTVRISGSLGTEDVNLASSAGAAGITSAINAVAGFTGVYATNNGGTVELRSGEFGEEQLIQAETIAGSLTGLGGAGTKTSDRGTNATVSFEGQQFEGVGNDFQLLARVANIEFTIASGTAQGAAMTFEARNTGLNFQLADAPRQTDRLAVGIDNVGSAALGIDTFVDQVKTAAGGTTVNSGGFLNSLITGGSNDLTNDPENASLIVDESIKQVGVLRGFLGAIQSQNLDPNISSLSVEIENLSASLSTIRDLDFASETAEFTKSQILFQANTAVLASANLIPQSVLTLLA